MSLLDPAPQKNDTIRSASTAGDYLRGRSSSRR